MKPFVLLIFLFLFQILNAEGQSTFRRAYQSNPNQFYGGSGALQTVDGGFIMVGCRFNSMLLIKTNSTGDVIWSQEYQNSSFFQAIDVQITIDGGYMILGSIGDPNMDVIVLKTDSLGNLLWAKNYDASSPDYGHRIAQVENDNFLIVAGGNYNMINYLIKINSNGDTLWVKSYNNIYIDGLNDCKQTSDGGYIIIGSIMNNAFGSDMLLLKTDTSGNPIWSKAYGSTDSEHGYKIEQALDGGFFLVGSSGNGLSLIKTDSIGDILWTRIYGPNCNYSPAICLSGNGDCLLLACTAGNIHLLKINSLGDTLWTRGTLTANGNFGRSINQTSDSGFIIAGAWDSDSISSCAYLVKTDSLGFSECHNYSPSFQVGNIPITVTNESIPVSGINMTITTPGFAVSSMVNMLYPCLLNDTIFDNTDEIIINDHDVDIFPNPSNSILNIQLTGTANNANVSIFEYTGEIIFQNIVSKEKKIDISQFSPGIYLIKIIIDDDAITKKVIIRH